MALIDCARTLPPGDAYSSLSLIGSAGAAYADVHHNMQLLFGGGRPAAFLTRDGDGYLVALLQEFVSALAEKREPSVPGADGLTVLQVVEAAAESLATGQAQSALSAALVRARGAYRALAVAAGKRNEAAFASARGQVEEDERAVDGALGGFALLGYRQ